MKWVLKCHFHSEAHRHIHLEQERRSDSSRTAACLMIYIIWMWSPNPGVHNLLLLISSPEFIHQRQLHLNNHSIVFSEAGQMSSGCVPKCPALSLRSSPSASLSLHPPPLLPSFPLSSLSFLVRSKLGSTSGSAGQCSTPMSLSTVMKQSTYGKTSWKDEGGNTFLDRRSCKFRSAEETCPMYENEWSRTVPGRNGTSCVWENFHL